MCLPGVGVRAEGDAYALDEISVTATKTERSLFETPEAVSRVGLEELERKQVQKLSDALKDVPGVSFGGGPRAVAEEPNIRGLSGSRILITVDGARQNFTSGHKGRVFIEPELLKSVEVMRGPGSALYGSGALGGVIAMTTKDASDFLMPGDRFGVRLKTGFQDANSDKLGTGIAFGRLDVGGGLEYLASVTRRSADDIRLGGGEVLDDSAEASWAGLAKLKWTPTPFQHISLSRQYSFDTGEVPAQADTRTSATAVLTDRETEVSIDRLTWRYERPDDPWLNFDLSAYNTEQTLREKRIGTNGRLDAIDFDTRGLELRNSSRLEHGGDIRHRFSYGLEYYRDRMSSREGTSSNDAFPDAMADFVGIYLQDEIDLDGTRLGDWVLIPGLRYDRYESRSDRARAIGVADETTANHVSPRLGLVYQATDWMNLTLNYSQAFRAPNFQEFYISGNHFGANNFQPNPELDPERLAHGLEAGVRIRRNDLLEPRDRLRLRASLYRNEYEDFIDSIVTTTVSTFDNISEARIRGTELEADYYSPTLDLDASLALTVTHGDNRTDGEPLSGIPGHSLTLNLRKYIASWGVSVGWRGAFHQRQDRVPTGAPETPGYSVHDLYLTWLPLVPQAVDDMQLNLGVDNVFDKEYRPHLSTLPAVGRNVKVSLSLQF
ncbi:TonB-dependent receptor [Thiohalobacter sp. COW1]|uniref:TonB-denpendent receptor n=1 Tax=Thiohalobacter thiocyanaticus TaxID=585455 RepID=A0A1Z4VPG3_9GAMM|nr:tonB-denpendent receptor [Thiohalobacter thiocyanaticus]BCO31432.1 TonB-dependent receptor [Thiohalobacter sp. COW1]